LVQRHRLAHRGLLWVRNRDCGHEERVWVLVRTLLATRLARDALGPGRRVERFAVGSTV